MSDLIRPYTLARCQNWFESFAHYPCLVAEREDRLIGYIYGGMFR